MTFKEKLERIKGLTVLYHGSKASVVQYYFDTERAMIRIHEGEGYTVDNGIIQTYFVSNGDDIIVVDAKDLSPMHR